MNLHKQNFVCWPSVGPQDIKQTYIHTYIHTYTAPLVLVVVAAGLAGAFTNLSMRNMSELDELQRLK